MNKKLKKRYVSKINELYIMTRQKHIIQTETGYVTITGTDSKPYTLVDWVVSSHIDNDTTIGVFSGQYLTKLVGFDVDSKDMAPSMTKNLVDILISEYGISSDSILVSLSGSKGYHVDVFFDKALSLRKARSFHRMVLESVGVGVDDIELRPTANQGYKLPLSIHRKTGRFSHIVDMHSLKKVPSEEIFNVKQESASFILETVNSRSDIAEDSKDMLVLDSCAAEEFEDVLDGLSMFVPTDYRDVSREVLSEMSLVHPDTRHRTTLFTGIYLKEQGYSQIEAINILSDVISNTYERKRDFIDHKTDIKHALREVKRLTALVYERNYNIQGREPEPIRIYKEDVILTLKPNRKQLRQLLFTMICHSKRYAKEDSSFYMAYSVMSQMGNTKNRARLYQYTCRLESDGYIDVVRRGKRRENSAINDVNVYRVNRERLCSSSEYIELDNIEANDWERVVTQLMTEKELKPLVSNRVFYSTFKPYYAV